MNDLIRRKGMTVIATFPPGTKIEFLSDGRFIATHPEHPPVVIDPLDLPS